MGFPIGITETGTGNDLLQQWWLVRTGNKNKEHLWARTWSARSRKKEWDVVAHRKACFLEFWIKFSGVQSAPKTCFQTQKCWRFDKFTFWESNIWQMYVSCISWCTWCVRGGPTGRSLWRFTSPYLSSFSSLSSDLSIPISKLHVQKLLGPSVCRTTAGCAPAVAPALGVAQQSELPHAQTAHRHRHECIPLWPLECRGNTNTWFFVWRNFFFESRSKKGRK